MSSTKPLWKGVLKVGELVVPTALIAARDPEGQKIEFNTAHRCDADTLTRINAKRWCGRCGHEVSETVRVFEHARGRYLEITDDDLRRCELARADVLEISAAIDSGVNPIFIETTAHLVPDGADAELAFETLRRGLGTRTAIASTVIRKRRVFIGLHALPSAFLAYVLRGRGQVRDLLERSSLPATPTQASVAIAKQLFGGLPNTFDYDDVPDQYGARVQALIARKTTAASRAMLKATLPAAQASKKRRRKA